MCSVLFFMLCLEYCHSAIASSIRRNHAMSGQPNRDLFFSQSKKSEGSQAKAGAASPDSYQGLVIRFLVASCFTSLSLRLLSLFSQDSCFTSRQEEKANSKAKVHPSEPSGKQYVDSKSSAIVSGCGQFMIPFSFADTFSNPHWGPHCRAEEGPVIKMIEWNFVLLIFKLNSITIALMEAPSSRFMYTEEIFTTVKLGNISHRWMNRSKFF